MPIRPRPPLPWLLLCASLIAACSVDKTGLGSTGGAGGTAAMDGGASGGASSAGGAGGATGGGGGGGLAGAAGADAGGAGGTPAVCGPATCPNGCCMDSKTCVTHRTVQLCGGAGASCAPCAACYRCSTTGACELDPAARWDLICASASVAPLKPGNTTWDTASVGTNPAPDPFCQLT